jgi:hypothetical protein
MRDKTPMKRNPNLDLIRGFAIILMVLDHALLAIASIFGSSDYINLIRLTLTRFSMPLFMITSGAVLFLYGIKLYRWLTILMLAIIINTFTFFLWDDFNFPEILLVWSFVMVFNRFFLRYPLLSMLIGFIQNQYFQISFFEYSGYQPGEILFFIVIGIFTSNYLINLSFPILSKLYIYKLMIVIGCKPLLIYFVHLLLLSLFVNYLPSF